MESSAQNTTQAPTPRQLGLSAADNNMWIQALLYLNQAARSSKNLHQDLQLLDALGEAAYQTGSAEALGPYQNYYKYPTVATHMARAFLMLGDTNSCREFLGYAKDSALKSALLAMLSMGSDIKASAAQVLPVAETFPDLYYPEYWRALAAVADAVGRDDLTKISERKSKAFAYKDPNIHFNQALRMLGKGEFRAGWRLYEWRLVPGASQSNRTELGQSSMWEGENLAGKTLLVFLEQGLGDCIFSLRYIQSLLTLGAQIEIAARPPLLRIIRTSFPKLKLHNEDELAVVGYWDKVPSPDFWVYSLSIPYRASLWQPINTGKFLSVDSALLSQSRKRIQEINPSRLPVFTVNWHGRIDTESDRTRAFTVSEFAKVSGIEQKPCIVISLQKDATAAEAQELQRLVETAGGKFINAAPELSDFAETAVWITASDQLLTCDTSVAHLGGALGHPTIVLARNKAIWQWLRKADSQQSIWYDSVQVQYALTPEISWLFTTITPAKEKKDDKFAERRNDDGTSNKENNGLQSSAVPTPQFRRKFHFAGRAEKQ